MGVVFLGKSEMLMDQERASIHVDVLNLESGRVDAIIISRIKNIISPATEPRKKAWKVSYFPSCLHSLICHLRGQTYVYEIGNWIGMHCEVRY